MSTAFLFNNKMMKYGTHVMGISSSPTPPTPVLPANTVRVRTNDGQAPVKVSNTTYQTATLVEGTSDVYDVYKSGTNFNNFLRGSSNITEVLGANTEGITDMQYMFHSCYALTTVPLFNTSSVTDMQYMFYECSALTSVPLFDTSSVTNMSHMFDQCSSLTTVPLFDTSSAIYMHYMFYKCTSLTAVQLFDTSSLATMDGMFNGCNDVESGALALYQQASSMTSEPSHVATFYRCGKSTVTGAAELAQIPSSWGGTGD